MPASDHPQDERVRPYKKEYDYSYTLGAFPTYELLDARPEAVRGVYVHSGFTDRERLEARCAALHVPVRTDDRLLSRLSPKENCYAAAVFDKYADRLIGSRDHVVLVHPGDMGNLGTILRTLAGFGIRDLGLVAPCADVFHPRTVRASMGALFRIRTEVFGSFDEYAARNTDRDFYPFMLDGERTLRVSDCPASPRYTLVFGNEATGLDPSFGRIGQAVRIPQTTDIDSLNLTIAVGIGVFTFTEKNPRTD
ncbi:MAG: TrmH family RNA methyltransferase [Clostridia bacterium]|nr:TrmH family RNA methyltransferase [Clostridia bacterium]